VKTAQKFYVVHRLSPPKKLRFKLFSQSYGHDQHFLYRNFISKVFDFCSTDFWTKTTSFLATWKTFSPNHDVMGT